MLDGAEIEAPWEWRIGVICEGFSIPPTAAMREVDETPMGLISDILYLRSYAARKRRYDAAWVSGTKQQKVEASVDPEFADIRQTERQILWEDLAGG